MKLGDTELTKYDELSCRLVVLHKDRQELRPLVLGKRDGKPIHATLISDVLNGKLNDTYILDEIEKVVSKWEKENTAN